MSFDSGLLRKCWFLAGPTACGKTAVSLRLAPKINAEIIALDAMTLYRGMDIGTAKPTVSERSQVPHHLIDVLDPHEEFNLAEFLDAAESVCRQIIGRGHTPLFVGGTGLYLRGILRGIFEGPSADGEIRKRLEAFALEKGPDSLHHRLSAVDPQTALRLHPNDQRRIIRALEVYELTGKPLSEVHDQRPQPLAERPRHVYWLSPPRDWLYRRIDGRVKQMISDGLLDEVKSLIARPRSLSRTARQALGYKEVIDWMSQRPSTNGALTLNAPERSPYQEFDDVIELIQTRTRQFAKRQHTWFRNLEECHPIEIRGDETPGSIADLILSIAAVNRSQGGE